nr:cell wall-binding repeat-containing protein [Clostridioides sp.]
MSKKRNLAVLMAAATVATSVAPVFADTTASLNEQEVSAKDSAKLDQLKKEVEGLLNTKYTTDEDLLLEVDGKSVAGESVYTITADVTIGTDTKKENITSMRDLDKAIAKLNSETDKIVINAVDRGFKEVDGKIVNNEVKKYKSAGIEALKAGVGTDDAIKITDADNADQEVAKVVDYTKDSVILELLNNKEKLTIKVGDLETIYNSATVDAPTYKVDGVKYKEDALGNKLDEDGKKTIIASEYVAIGFDTRKTPIGLDDKENKSYTIVNKEVVESINASELYNLDLEKLTQKGNEISNFIYDYNHADDTDDSVGISREDGILKLTVKVNKDGVENKFTNLSIKGTKNELDSLEAIFKKAHTQDVVPAEKINTLAGADREDTAIRVSQNSYDKGTAKNVVLVSGYKVADGLTATPLAAAKEAPVLLTGSSDKLSKSVMDEIKRVMTDGGTVYLVGGESSLSKNIENELDSKFIKVKRIAGTDRMNTSLKVAQSLVNDKHTTLNNGLFVAGGYAEADAMSVASVAAKGTKVDDTMTGITPILLSDNNGLTQDQLTWLNREDASIAQTYIAGGVNSVPTTVSSQLNPFTAKTTRLAGEDRQETNAKVISEFYTTATNLYVAKSDNNGLVDALPSGVLAAKTGKVGPIVLATDELNSLQKSALEKAGFDADTASKTQIGNGIADKVWKAINDIK